jgi:hypothetical protein
MEFVKRALVSAGDFVRGFSPTPNRVEKSPRESSPQQPTQHLRSEQSPPDQKFQVTQDRPLRHERPRRINSGGKVNHTRRSLFAGLVLLSLSLAGITLAQEPLPNAEPVNVEGKWTISARNPNGSVDTKYVELKQNGNQITGHFKGPNQSGGLQGTVNGHHIFFRTKTREPLGFRGMVNGDTIEGTFHARAGQGEFRAYREGTNGPN